MRGNGAIVFTNRKKNTTPPQYFQEDLISICYNILQKHGFTTHTYTYVYIVSKTQS